jgi:hypothetical protein
MTKEVAIVGGAGNLQEIDNEMFFLQRDHENNEN